MSSELNSHFVTRMSGAGNTFFIANYLGPASAGQIRRTDRPSFVRQTCQGLVGMATDGFLFLENSAGYDFIWDFYNSDGSSAEMCGNAARCVALYHFEKIKPNADVNWLTPVGPISARVTDPDAQVVQVLMPKPQVQNPSLRVGKTIGYSVNTGVPHFVIEGAPDFEIGKALRSASEFGAAGTNVTFIQADSSELIQAVTYERGVENFTLACGTGAVAAAKYHHDKYPEIPIQHIEMPGGLLVVEWQKGSPLLTGTAEFQFDAHFYGEFSGEIK